MGANSINAMIKPNGICRNTEANITLMLLKSAYQKMESAKSLE